MYSPLFTGINSLIPLAIEVGISESFVYNFL
jgi:hypothetical protein